MRTVEEKLATNQYVTQDELDFIAVMRHYASKGVGYGWMQQVIEWEWQSKANGAWGPEYFERQIRELETRLAQPEARSTDYILLDNLADAAQRFRDAFTYDPGHSDLDNEQPITLTVTLGDWRRLNRLLPQHGEGAK